MKKCVDVVARMDHRSVYLAHYTGDSDASVVAFSLSQVVL